MGKGLRVAYSCVDAGHSGVLILFVLDANGRLDHAPQRSLAIQRLRYDRSKKSKAKDSTLYLGESLCSFAVTDEVSGEIMSHMSGKRVAEKVSAHK